MRNKRIFKFSVVLYLDDEVEKPIENIVNQTFFSEIQLILMTENYNKLCSDYESNFDNVLYVSNINKKDSLRIGFDYSEGVYLFFMNDTDYLDLDLFSIVDLFINSNPDTKIISLNHILNDLEEYEIKKNCIIDINEFKPEFLYLNSFIIKKSCIEKKFLDNDLLLLINSISNVKIISLLNSTNIFSKNKNIDNLLFNIEQIFDYLRNKKTFPKFLQRVLINYFVILVENSKTNDISFFIKNLLPYINEEIIISKDFNKFLKKELLFYKSNEKFNEEYYENNCLLKYDNEIIDKFADNKLYINSVKINGNILEIKGKFYSCFDNDKMIIRCYNGDLDTHTEINVSLNPFFNKSEYISFESYCKLDNQINSIDFRIIYGSLVFTPTLSYDFIDENQKDTSGFYDLNFFKDKIEVKSLKKSLFIDCEEITNERDINNEIFTLWVSDDDYLPELSYLALKSMLLVGHDVTLYTYKYLKNIPEGVNIVDANTILDKSKIFKYKYGHKTYSGFANWFRLKRLYEYGGIWLDLDIILIRNVNDLVSESISICSEPHRDFFFFNNNAFLKFPKHDPCIKYMLDYAEERGDEVYHGETGPKLVQKILSDNFIEYNKYLKAPNVNNYFGWWDIDRFFEDTEYLVNNFDFSEIVGFHLTNTFFAKIDFKKDPPKGFYKDIKEAILSSSSKQEYITKLNQLKILDSTDLNRLSFFNSNYLSKLKSKKVFYSFLIDSKNLRKNELYKLIDSISRISPETSEIIVFGKTNIVKESLPKDLNVIFLNNSFENIKGYIIDKLEGEVIIPINKPLIFKEDFFNIFNDLNYFDVINIKFPGINKIDDLKIYNKNMFKLTCENVENIFDVSKSHIFNMDAKLKEIENTSIFSLVSELSNTEKIIIENINLLKGIFTDVEFNKVKEVILNNFSEDMSLKLSYYYYQSAINVINSNSLQEFRLKNYVDDLENFIFELLRK